MCIRDSNSGKDRDTVAGCKVVIMEEAAGVVPAAFVSAIQVHQITHVLAVPQLLSAVAAAASAATQSCASVSRQPREPPLGSLLYIASSGDVLPMQTIRRLQVCVAPEAVILNIYGSCETTADCLVSEVQQVLPAPPVVATDGRDGDTQSHAWHSGDGAATGPEFVPLGHSLGCSRVYLLPWNDDEDQSAAGEKSLRKLASDLKRKRDIDVCISQHGVLQASAVSDNAFYVSGGKQLYRLVVSGPCVAQGYLAHYTAPSHVIEAAHELLQADGFCWISHQQLQSLRDRYGTWLSFLM